MPNRMGKNSKKLATNSKKTNIDGFLIITLLATVAVYMSSMKSDILNFDDNEYFSNYPEIFSFNLQSIKAYFSNYYVMMYQPLPVMTFAWSYSLFKFDLTGHHVLNLIFHLINCVLVYRLVAQLNPNVFVKRTVVFLFALHPLAVEAVMWISCRSSGMYTCFYLAGLLTYLDYKKTNSYKTLLLCGLLFLLSLFSKAQAVTFPIVLLILDYFHFKSGITKKSIIEKIPFLLLSIVFGIAALLNTDTVENIAFTASAYSILDYFFILCYESIWYLYKLLLPFNLSPIYVYPVKENGLLPVIYYVSLLAIVALIYLVYRNFKSRNYLLFGLLFFYVTIAITFQIIPSRLFVVADRYGYLPNIGLFYIIGCLLAEWKEGKINFLKGMNQNPWPMYLVAFGLMFLSFQQSKIWKTDETLSTRIIEANPETDYIARAYGIRGNYKKNISQQPEEALLDYKKAMELDSTDMISRNQAAVIYLAMGDTVRAISHYRLAHKADPLSPVPYTDLGVMFSVKSNFIKAQELADSALLINKKFPNALVLKAVCMLNLGNPKGAEAVLSQCIKFNPRFPEGYKNRGIIRINNLNNKNGACLDFNMAANLGDADAKEILRSYCN
jgi:tetratricopeptide (TPR) repeat protein